MDEYRADLKAKIAKRHEDSANTALDEQLVDALIEKLKADIPAPMFEAETENFLRDYDNRLRMSGLDLNTYFKYTGMTLESMREQFRPQAERQVKARLALEKIVELENIVASEEDINAEYERIAAAYNMPVDKVKESIPADAITEDMRVKKAMDMVREKAVVTDAAPEVKKPAAKKTTTAKKTTSSTTKKTTTTRKTTTKKTEAPATEEVKTEDAE
jgi:trigger factor